MPKNPDPPFLSIRKGLYLSKHAKAKKQYAEDDPRFNPMTMGNRIFKKIPSKRMKAAQAVQDETRTAIRRAAANKLRTHRTSRYKSMKGKYS